MRRDGWLIAVAAVPLLAACTSAPAPTSTASSTVAPSSSAARTPTRPAPGTESARAQATTPATTPATTHQTVPRFAHIVVVVMENHADTQIIGNPAAPYLNQLASAGLLLTDSHAITHPSQPNYLALFSGSTDGVTSDSCPQRLTGPNLASNLISRGLAFAGYSEGLPSAGYEGCSAGNYVRRHNPWVDFPAVPPAANQPFTAFPSDFSRLPTVSFVVPDLEHDMHNGTISQGDAWLQSRLSAYARWSLSHDSLLLITWDEDDSGHGNHIPTILYGADLESGTDSSPVTHYGVLRTIEDAYRLPPIGASARAAALSADWQP